MTNDQRMTTDTAGDLSVSSGSSKRDFSLVFVVAVVVLVLKLFLSYHVYGTNDTASWIRFTNIVQESGTFEIYALASTYNHPPLISWVLIGVHWIVAETGLDLPFVFRLLPIAADFASVFVLWQLLALYGTRHRTLICLISAVNPINFLVSGFHSNTDSVFIFLVLLAIYFLERGKVFRGGIIFGLSMCVKIVPIILFPVFTLLQNGMRRKTLFLFGASVILMIVFLPYLMTDCQPIIRNIFLYRSDSGMWGLGNIFYRVSVTEEVSSTLRTLSVWAFRWHIDHFIQLFISVLVFLGALLVWRRRINLLEGTFFTLCLFLVLTSGFGVQYLAWLSMLAPAVSLISGTAYVFLGGIFLASVYWSWGASKFPYFANGSPWEGTIEQMALFMWMMTVLLLIQFLVRKLRRKNSGKEDGAEKQIGILNF